MKRRIQLVWSSILLRLSQRLWFRGHDVLALKLALAAASQLDAAKVVAAIFYGFAGDLKRGIPLLEAAANGGSWEAKQVLSARYLHGEGVPKDIERARQLATEAADQGSLDSMIWLSIFYSDGQLHEPDWDLARKYGMWAASNGRPDVMEAVEKLMASRAEVWGKSVYDPDQMPPG